MKNETRKTILTVLLTCIWCGALGFVACGLLGDSYTSDAIHAVDVMEIVDAKVNASIYYDRMSFCGYLFLVSVPLALLVRLGIAIHE